jgi:large conductance mechanosensitive channel
VIKGFKDFLFRGNVLDLAIAVVIGVAFTAVVTAIVDNLVQPIVNVFAGSHATGLGFYIVSANAQTFVNFGAIFSAIINFLIVAAVVYFVLVVPSQRLLAARAARTGQADQAAPVASEDVLLLREIRDLLVAQNGGSTPTSGFAGPLD